MLTPGDNTKLEKAIQMIKGGSAYRIRQQLAYKFPVWQPGYHDRWARDAREYQIRKRYMEQNPVRARLVENPEEFPLSSAGSRIALDVSAFGV